MLMKDSIISLVPSLTETIIDIGQGDRLIGRTKFCVHPENVVKNITKVGGTKNPQVDRIIEMNPSIIIANKEENRQEDIAQLRKAGIEVLVTDVYDIDSAKSAILEIGEAIGAKDEAEKMISTIELNESHLDGGNKINAIYLIWKDPYMTIGGDTYISDVMERIGFNNLFKDQDRYPELDENDLKSADVILLSSEPYPFQQSHADEIMKNTHVPTTIVDGEYFSWYGSRMIEAFQKLSQVKREILNIDR